MACYAESIKKYKSCQHCSKDFANYQNKKFCSNQCRIESRIGNPLSKEWRLSLSNGRKNSDLCKGENLYNWKGGKETEPARLRISAIKRRSAQSVIIEQHFLNNLILAQGFKCFYCDCDLTTYRAIEHLTPLARGGDNHKYNIVYSCKSCNSKKATKTLEEFAIAQQKYFLFDKFDMVYMAARRGERDLPPTFCELIINRYEKFTGKKAEKL